jgi:hypothetical protein
LHAEPVCCDLRNLVDFAELVRRNFDGVADELALFSPDDDGGYDKDHREQEESHPSHKRKQYEGDKDAGSDPQRSLLS